MPLKTSGLSFLGNISAQQFLDEYWQQKPLVIRQAFPELELPFSPEELAGLACDTDAPSRIVMENINPQGSFEKPWITRHAPFKDEDFTSLPDTHWTLLVNDIERYVPELGNFIEPFRFIPDWRIDDVMVSYAADQGSVGPHTDEYDVFLIQGMGKRRWNIISRKDYPKATVPNLSLSILSEFDADEEWLLEPGDMLYLPPNVPHFGIAEGECMTFSVGFRAPSQQELIQAYLESVLDNPATNSPLKQRFSDASRKPQVSSGEISHTDIESLSRLLIEGMQSSQQDLSIWLGRYLTETRGEISQDIDHDNIDSENEINTGYSEQQSYERESWLRFAYIESGDTINFFAGGKHVILPGKFKKTIQQLCSDYYYTAGCFTELISNTAFSRLFEELLAENAIYPSD